MSREEVFKATGPTSGASMWVKMGVKKDGTLTAADGGLQIPGRRLPGLAGDERCDVRLRPLQRSRTRKRTVGYDVVSNRPKAAAYRAPGSPISAFAVESTLDILAKKIGMDPLELRLKNAATHRHPDDLRPQDGPRAATPRRCRRCSNHPGYKAPLGPNQGRGVASGYWFNGAGDSGATVYGQRRRHRDRSPPAAPTSAARAPRWRSWPPRRWAWTTKRSAPR